MRRSRRRSAVAEVRAHEALETALVSALGLLSTGVRSLVALACRRTHWPRVLWRELLPPMPAVEPSQAARRAPPVTQTRAPDACHSQCMRRGACMHEWLAPRWKWSREPRARGRRGALHRRGLHSRALHRESLACAAHVWSRRFPPFGLSYIATWTTLDGRAEAVVAAAAWKPELVVRRRGSTAHTGSRAVEV